MTIWVVGLTLPVRGEAAADSGFSPVPEYLGAAPTALVPASWAPAPGPDPAGPQTEGVTAYGEGFGAPESLPEPAGQGASPKQGGAARVPADRARVPAAAGGTGRPMVPLALPAASAATSDATAQGARAGSDLVLSPKDVDGEIARNEQPEPAVELDGAFFANAVEEIGKGDEGSYAGLTGRIEKFIGYFQNRGRDRFEVWLSRSGKYSDIMRGILAEYGLPQDLLYLALIESGFSPKAYSVARAAGPWQFIAGTARRYGLRVDWWADERRDYEKSTHAAASYLRDLYGMFDSWPLAAAAYNAGEGKITRAVARYKTEDYAKLIRYRYLKPETKDYVPKMLAALSIAKDPERYGFGEVLYEAPLEFDKVTVPGATDVSALGRILDVPAEDLRELNPELKRFCTPPNREQYEIRVPKGLGDVALERMEEIRTEAKVTFLHHAVGRKETLASLAERYDTSVAVLKEINGLRSDSLGRARRVIIPVTGLSAEASVPGREVSPDQLKLAHMRVDEGYRRGQRVRVRRGDTLSKIARQSGVPVRELMRANGIRNAGALRAGAILRIPARGARRVQEARAVQREGKPGSRHVVRPGETLWSIARAHGVTVNRLAERNNVSTRALLRSGRVLLIPTES